MNLKIMMVGCIIVDIEVHKMTLRQVTARTCLVSFKGCQGHNIVISMQGPVVGSSTEVS